MLSPLLLTFQLPTKQNNVFWISYGSSIFFFFLAFPLWKEMKGQLCVLQTKVFHRSNPNATSNENKLTLVAFV